MPKNLFSTTMRLPLRLLQLADRRAESLGLSRTKYVERLIRRDLMPLMTEPLPPAPSAKDSVFG